jgi:hypothetical protein
MKEKTKAILAGEPRSDVDFHRIIDFPDIIDDNTRQLTALRGIADSWEVELAAEIRLRAAPAQSRQKAQSGLLRVDVVPSSPSDADDQSSAESLSDEDGFDSDDSDGDDNDDDDASSTVSSEWPEDTKSPSQ